LQLKFISLYNAHSEEAKVDVPGCIEVSSCFGILKEITARERWP